METQRQGSVTLAPLLRSPIRVVAGKSRVPQSTSTRLCTMELLLLQHPSANRWVRIRFAAATGLPARPRPRAPLPLRNIAAAFFARSDSQVCTDYPVCDGPAACSAIGCGTCTGYNGVPGTCTSSGCYSCDSFFGGDCDNYCNEYEALGSSCACDSGSYATTGCDSGCTSGCPASCAVGDYGAAEHVTRGPRAVAESPNNSRPRRTPGHPPPSHARVAGTPSLCNSSGAVTGGCSTCSNRPANSTYTNVSATSTCPYACSAGFYRSGSTCPACRMTSPCFTSSPANRRFDPFFRPAGRITVSPSRVTSSSMKTVSGPLA